MTIITEPVPSEDAPAAPSTPIRWGRVVAAVLVVLGLGFGAWWLFIRDDSPTDANLPEVAPGSVGTIPPAAEALPDTEGSTLLELLEKGHALTFHATYDAVGDPESFGGDLTVEVWRDDGNIRQDTLLKTSSATIRTAGFVLDGETLTCSQQDNQPWSCSSAPDPGTNEDGLFGSVAEELNGVDVTESKATVAGHEARCFSFPTGDGTGKMCLRADGLPLSLSANGQELVLAEVSAKVDGSVFEPPADPDDPATAPTS